MQRFDDCICGTSTTGTGTLTLAAPPAAFAGIDPDVWARATGIGFGNSAAFLVDYVITENTDATSLKEKSKEAGTGTLTLGGSAGIANCTLARTTINWTATSLDAQPATLTVDGATAITIGTAANVLVMVSPSVMSMNGASRYFDTTASVGPGNPVVGGFGGNFGPANNIIYYIPLARQVGGFITKLGALISATYTGQNNNLYGAIYDVGTNGRPGVLLADFGVLGTANSSFASATAVLSAALANALYLPPSIYVLALQAIWTAGGTGTPGVATQPQATPALFGSGTTRANVMATATGGSAAFAISATTTGWAFVAQSAISNPFWVGLQ